MLCVNALSSAVFFGAAGAKTQEEDVSAGNVIATEITTTAKRNFNHVENGEKCVIISRGPAVAVHAHSFAGDVPSVHASQSRRRQRASPCSALVPDL